MHPKRGFKIYSIEIADIEHTRTSPEQLKKLIFSLFSA